MLRVRKVTPADIESIVWLGAALRLESPEYRDMRYSPEKAAEFVAMAADAEVEHVAGWVAETQEGAVVGFILAYTTTHLFFDDTITWDGTLYLQPAQRGRNGRTVARLIGSYVDWAKQWGGPIKFGLTTNIETDRMEAMLQRYGFETTGRTLTYVRR